LPPFPAPGFFTILPISGGSDDIGGFFPPPPPPKIPPNQPLAPRLLIYTEVLFFSSKNKILFFNITNGLVDVSRKKG
jgi:hypothetical protein